MACWMSSILRRQDLGGTHRLAEDLVAELTFERGGGHEVYGAADERFEGVAKTDEID